MLRQFEITAAHSIGKITRKEIICQQQGEVANGIRGIEIKLPPGSLETGGSPNAQREITRGK